MLERITYLLTSAASPAALEPCLGLLGNLALGGADVAYAICHTPQLVRNAVYFIPKKTHSLAVVVCVAVHFCVTICFACSSPRQTDTCLYCGRPAQVEGIVAILDLRSSVSGSEAAAKAQEAARPAALRALCLLCKASTHTARRLLAEGHCPPRHVHDLFSSVPFPSCVSEWRCIFVFLKDL